MRPLDSESVPIAALWRKEIQIVIMVWILLSRGKIVDSPESWSGWNALKKEYPIHTNGCVKPTCLGVVLFGEEEGSKTPEPLEVDPLPGFILLGVANTTIAPSEEA